MTIAEIDDIARDYYGAGVLELSPLAALWLIDHIQSRHGMDVNRQVRAYRDQHGKATSYPI